MAQTIYQLGALSVLETMLPFNKSCFQESAMQACFGEPLLFLNHGW
jgi:hypothetical protein